MITDEHQKVLSADLEEGRIIISPRLIAIDKVP